MIGLRAVVPLALALGGVEAYSDLAGVSPARQTLGALLKAVNVAAPAPTDIPPSKHLKKRATNTCGYVDGDPVSGVTCNADLGAECLYDSTVSAVGCCATVNCNIWTACLDSTDSDATSTADMDRTRYCSLSASPFCGVYEYQDDEWNGYTMHLCDSVRTTYDFFFTAEGISEGTTGIGLDDPTSTVSDSTETTADREPTTTDDGDNEDDDGAPIGAIVGGTIGGVAVLALVGVAAFFILRRRKNSDPEPTAQPQTVQYPSHPGGQYPSAQVYMPVPGMPPHQQGPGTPGTQHGVPVMGGYYDPANNRGSVAKPPLSPTSPNPSQYNPQYNPSDPSQYNPSLAGTTPLGVPPSSTSPPAGGQHTTPPPPGYPVSYSQHGYPPQPQTQGAVELPTTRPDGELRELS